MIDGLLFASGVFATTRKRYREESRYIYWRDALTRSNNRTCCGPRRSPSSSLKHSSSIRLPPFPKFFLFHYCYYYSAAAAAVWWWMVSCQNFMFLIRVIFFSLLSLSHTAKINRLDPNLEIPEMQTVVHYITKITKGNLKQFKKAICEYCSHLVVFNNARTRPKH